MDQPAPATGRFDGAAFLFPMRVYFEDTDVMGIVYYANYLKWFERARWEMLRALGVDLLGSQERGDGAYAVTEANLKYRGSARLDDSIIIRSTADEIRAASVLVRQQAWRGDELLVEGALRVGFISPEGRPIRQPDEWRAAFSKLLPAKDPA
ncbi:YbgC/FadM family acyl-CoA thioesterase [Paraurantiacibacter namhicola]|uniref:Acyl-CoA thioester hydrolase YbgC n=1 Tax=Paraurantiacibacter namhicola TaxID=645517 RepID=A0A1C7D744_9SPHN|nr:YbgC/FadM family acyl-CoA thioesterase [Paraurantiacibacter namhicola]ANU07300.1 Acyl-CoA thioester hydrolase YbgC [Paraurantiacibacter namhicola]